MAAPETAEITMGIEEESFMPCKLTPAMAPSYVPEYGINPHGNLTRKPGSPWRAKGMYSVISGTVVNEDCVPIPNVSVQLWQLDSYGRQFKDYKNENPWVTYDEEFDPNFSYSGAAKTDNLGRFNLITILPGAHKEDAPHFNLRFYHHNYNILFTRMYIKGHPRNAEDPALSELLDEQKDRVMVKGVSLSTSGMQNSGRHFDNTYVLGGVDRYRGH